MNRNRILFSLLTAATLLTGCTAGDEASHAEPSSPGTAAVRGSTGVGFDAYLNRSVTRAGYNAGVDLDALKDPAKANGFGVFAYYTDLKKYDQTYLPNFMYNTHVSWDGTSAWTYSPLMYWPNEYGAKAASDDEDKVSFFAYAPYVAHTSAASGSVSDASWGITGFSRNTSAGDPMVRYMVDFGHPVDLCWGVFDGTSWQLIQTSAAQTSLETGKPWLDVEHPAGTNQKMKFQFLHALSQLTVKIDADVDAAAHGDGIEVDDNTRIYVRSISFTGIATKGALNLNNTVVNQALWLDYSGTTDLPYGESVTVKDGRRDGREGATGAEATNETPSGLNTAVIQEWDDTEKGFKNPGVIKTQQNLFSSGTAYVIPTGEPMTVTIVYDVETKNPALSTYISDGVTSGVSIENKITKTGIFTSGLQNGYSYTLNLHLGMNSVKFDAEVGSWQDADAADAWVPGNEEGGGGGSGPLSLSLGAMSLTLGGSAQSLSATTNPAGQDVMWSNSDDGVASIAAASALPAPARFGRRAVQNVGPCPSVNITPVAAGTTFVTATAGGVSRRCQITVKDTSKDDATVTAPTAKTSLAYTDAAQALVNAGSTSDGTLKYAIGTADYVTGDYSESIPEATAAGTYYVWYYVAGDASHNDSAPEKVAVTIAKAAGTLNAFATAAVNKGTSDGTYTQTTTCTGDGTITYSIANAGGSNATINTATGEVSLGSAAGTATVTARVTDGTNYSYAVKTQTYVINISLIAPATPAAITAAANLKPTDTSSALVIVGDGLDGGTMQYAVSTTESQPAAGDFSATVPTVGTRPAGTYYVYYYAKASDASHVDSAVSHVTVTIVDEDDVTAKGQTFTGWTSGGDASGELEGSGL